jgi:hypothetical protein
VGVELASRIGLTHTPFPRFSTPCRSAILVEVLPRGVLKLTSWAIQLRIKAFHVTSNALYFCFDGTELISEVNDAPHYVRRRTNAGKQESNTCMRGECLPFTHRGLYVFRNRLNFGDRTMQANAINERRHARLKKLIETDGTGYFELDFRIDLETGCEFTTWYIIW